MELPGAADHAPRVVRMVRDMTNADRNAPRPPDSIWLAAAPTRCDHRLSAASRRDPYWEARPGSFVWHTIEQFRAAAERGYGRRYHAADRRAAARGLDVLQAPPRDTAAALGAVYSYRTISVAQLAAVTGDTRILGGRTAVLEALWALGLIEVGRWAGEGIRTPLFGPESLLRPGARAASVYLQLAQHTFTWAESVAVTGGGPWSQRGRHDRHDVLATELTLRFVEYSDSLATVLGEAYSTLGDLLEPVRNGRVKHSGAADLTLVRRDGMRIAVELTASTGSGFARKVDRWAHALADTAPEEAGSVFVLFVVAPPPGVSTGPRTGVLREVRATLHRATHHERYAGPSTARTADLMGVVTWRDLFPEAGQMTTAFTNLKAACPPLPYGADTQWRRVRLLGPGQRAAVCAMSAEMQAVSRNASALAQTPHWLVDPNGAPDLVSPLARQVGWR